MTDALNQVAQETIDVTGVPVALVMPPVLSSTGQVQRDNDNRVMRYRPRKAILRNTGGQPVRWASGPPPTEVSAISGTLLPADAEERLMDSGQDYFGILKRMKLVRDADATGNSTVEITYFA